MLNRNSEILMANIFHFQIIFHRCMIFNIVCCSICLIPKRIFAFSGFTIIIPSMMMGESWYHFKTFKFKSIHSHMMRHVHTFDSYATCIEPERARWSRQRIESVCATVTDLHADIHITLCAHMRPQ